MAWLSHSSSSIIRLFDRPIRYPDAFPICFGRLPEKSITAAEKSSCFGEKFILSLKIIILRLRIIIARLKIYIFNAKINFAK